MSQQFRVTLASATNTASPVKLARAFRANDTRNLLNGFGVVARHDHYDGAYWELIHDACGEVISAEYGPTLTSVGGIVAAVLSHANCEV